MSRSHDKSGNRHESYQEWREASASFSSVAPMISAPRAYGMMLEAMRPDLYAQVEVAENVQTPETMTKVEDPQFMVFMEWVKAHW